MLLVAGCATIRVTDPPRTATEQFLLSVAAQQAVDQISATALRDRVVFVDSQYLISGQPAVEQSFLIGELRARLLQGGVRLANRRDEAQIILELRAGALGIDRTEFLLGIPSLYIGAATDVAGAPIATPELALVKSTRQRGYASVSFVAYWRDTGELVAASGPTLGRTVREDFWFFGVGPRTVGNIPPAQQ
jgi:hypothetical protein